MHNTLGESKPLESLNHIKGRINALFPAKGQSILLRDMFVIERDGRAYALFPALRSRLDGTFIGYRWVVYDVDSDAALPLDSDRYWELQIKSLPMIDATTPTPSRLGPEERRRFDRRLDSFARILLERGRFDGLELAEWLKYLDERGPRDTKALEWTYGWFREHYSEDATA